MQGNNIEEPVEKVINTLSDKVAIANCILTAFLLVITAISVYCAYRAYKSAVQNYNLQKERAKKDAACDLARYYAQNIIDEFRFFLDVLTFSQLNNKIESLFPYDDISLFDREELEKLINRAGQNFEDVEREMDFVSPLAIYQAEIVCAKSIEERHTIAAEYTVIKNQKDGEPPEIGIANENMLWSDFHRKIATLLNDLEYFAMSCQYGLADEEMLYQSLHQTYISQVRFLYFYISRNNTTNEDKFYTNLIWLFNLWKNRLTEIQDIRRMQQAEAAKLISFLEAQLEELKEESKHINSNIYIGSMLK